MLGKGMKRKTIIVRICVIVAFLTVTVLWLGELTQRRARWAADHFMGPFLTRLGCDGTDFWLFGPSDQQDKIVGPRWHVRYDSQFPGCYIDPPYTVRVDLLGRVRSVNRWELNALIGLPDEEIYRKIGQMVQEEVERDRRHAEEYKKMKAEQSAAPLPLAPQPGPSEGAR